MRRKALTFRPFLSPPARIAGQIDKAADRHPAMSERQQALTAMAGKDGHGKVSYW